MQITKDAVLKVWDNLSARYNTKVFAKEGSLLMWFIGLFLDTIGILDKEVFRSRFTTTIGRRIYVPAVIGEGDTNTLWFQIKLAVHEHTHAVQLIDIGSVPFTFGYLLSSRKRALYESEAYVTGIELELWRTSGTAYINTQEIANRLKNYGCTPQDIAAAKKVYDNKVKALKGGGPWEDMAVAFPVGLSPITMRVIDILNEGD